MSKLSGTFTIPQKQEDALWTCKEAIGQIGWSVAAMEAGRIVPKVGAGLTRNPAKLEVLVEPDGPDYSQVTINGSIMGFGPFQKRHLTGQMNQLRNAIEVAGR